MATLYRAETTLQDILNMRVGDELQLAGGGDLPEYTEDDAGKALQVNQAGNGLEWGPGVPSYTFSDVGKVLTVGQRTDSVVVVPEQTVTTDENGEAPLTGVDFSRLTDGQSVRVNAFGDTLNTIYTEERGLVKNGHTVVSTTTLFGPINATTSVSASAMVTHYITTQFVPEQTVTFDENSEAVLTGVDALPTDFAGGDMVVLTATFDGETNSAELEWDSEISEFSSGDAPVAIYYSREDEGHWCLYIDGQTGTTSTVSAVLKESVPTADWEKVDGLPDYSNATENSVLTLINGVPRWYYTGGSRVIRNEWTLKNQTVTATAGQTVSLTNGIEERGWGVFAPIGKRTYYWVDYSPLYEFGLIPVGTINTDVDRLISEIPPGNVTLSPLKVYAAETLTNVAIPTTKLPVYIVSL